MSFSQPSIGVNEFVLRQTADSPFSHFEGTWGVLKELARDFFKDAKPGYRPGVLLVPVPPRGFYSGVIEVTHETPLKAALFQRRQEEAPFIQVTGEGKKLPAKEVELVLYSKATLDETGDSATGAEWDIISINARPTEGPEPMAPMAMARNFLDLPGGTKAEYTAEEFAKAIIYWSARVNITPSK